MTSADDNLSVVRAIPPATRREGAAEGSREDVAATRREQAATTAYVRVNLPPELAARYEVLRGLPSGGESDVLLARRRTDADTSAVVVKIYRHGIEPDPEALARIRALPAGHVVEILACGHSEAGWWEEQEYVELGSLADLLAAEGPALGEARLLEVVGELTSALEAVHPVLHRDLKPENVLVRSLDPLDLLLGDFGLARSTEYTHIVSTRAGSLAYQSPEALDGGASTARDWWAVGMIVAQAAIGRHPFYEPGLGWPSEAELRIALTTRPVPLDGIADPRIRLLCRGLLVRDPRQRWTAAQVRAWLSGKSPEVATDTAEARRAPSVQALAFGGQRASAPQELAPLLAARWDDAIRLLAGAASEAPDYVRLLTWLREHEHEDAVRILERSAHDRSHARRLFRLLRVLDPALPPTFRGHVIDRDGLRALAGLGAAGDRAAATVLHDVHHLGLVAELAREDAHEDLLAVDDRWRAQTELLERLGDELGSIAAPLDDDDARRTACARIVAAVLDEAELESLAAQVGSADDDPALTENPAMSELFARLLTREPAHYVAALLVRDAARDELPRIRAARKAEEQAALEQRRAAEAAALAQQRAAKEAARAQRMTAERQAQEERRRQSLRQAKLWIVGGSFVVGLLAGLTAEGESAAPAVLAFLSIGAGAVAYSWVLTLEQNGTLMSWVRRSLLLVIPFWFITAVGLVIGLSV